MLAARLENSDCGGFRIEASGQVFMFVGEEEVLVVFGQEV